MSSVLVRGDGVAARTSVRLLKSAGLRVLHELGHRSGGPTLMLPAATVELIRDVFDRPGLFSRLRRIERRIVSWGEDSAPQSLPHDGVVVGESELLDELASSGGALGSEGPMFTISASRPLPAATVERKFGTRRTTACRATLSRSAEPSACWVESAEAGWLFLLPESADAGCLLAAGGSVRAMLRQSRLIADRIAELGEEMGEFPTSPRIAFPLAGPDWLICGAAGLGFDPICGDGVGQAIRQGILAAAVVRTIADGAGPEPLMAHYQSSLIAAMRRHLRLCADFYRTGGSGKWWRAEETALIAGHEWCTARLNEAGDPRYELHGLDLVARG